MSEGGEWQKVSFKEKSMEYYDRLKDTPVEELLAETITYSLNKNIKVI